jgi:tetratricopeptide (TPR) repeat protein
MQSELREQLQTALGAAYTLERELGGGGMSRVFLAHDPALDRDVVVKVLHPELAGGVNVDRFKREIQLAAQLQHPHIVPLLAAGEMDGLPYLTMPYVAGRSLRERLADTPVLPVDEALGILRDVARALAFAHGRGVIHRDIKPDNVLLAEGSATVTDFGVAKAVSAARAGANATLTSVGMSIGTPTYMAPEQAAGDPDTDHRADIYAWGVMAYEMLAGRPPFNAKAPHKLLAAHMSEAPEPITDHRPDCPAPLAELVMRCLAKNPEQRPQGAAELARGLAEVGTPSGGGHETLPAISLATRRTLTKALGIYAAAFVVVAALAQTAVMMIGLPDWVLPGTLVVMALGLPVVLFTAFVNHGSRVARTMAMLTPGGTVAVDSTMTRIAVKASPHVTWRRTALGGVTAVSVFAALVVVFMVLRALGIGPAGSLLAKGVISDRDQILVADFTAPASDSGLGTVVGEAVRMGLTESGAVRVMQPTQVTGALTRMQRDPSSRLDRALAQEVAQREGAKAIVDGDVTPLGAGYIVTVRLRGTDPPDEMASYRETAASATDLVPAIDLATRKLRAKIGESLKAVRATVPLERATTASLPALRKFTEGFRRNTAGDYAAAIPLLEEAIALDSNFALAYRQLSLVYSNAGLRPGRRDSLRDRAFDLRDRLPELERALVEATYYNGGAHADRAKSIAANERALTFDPTSASALNGLGLLLSSRGDYARAESLYKRGWDAHPDNAILLSNLTITRAALGKDAEARRTMEEYRQRFPGSAQGVLLGAWVWGAAGRTDSAAADCQRGTLSSGPQFRANSFGCLSVIAATAGRLRESDRLAGQFRSINAARGGAPVRDDAAVLDSAYDDIWFHERMEEGVRRLDQVAAERAPSLTFVEYYAYAGRPDKARAMLVRYDSMVGNDTARIRLNRNLRRRALGELAIAERQYDVAIRELHGADTLYDGSPIGCKTCIPARLARAYDLAGKSDEAIAHFERYVSIRWPMRLRDTDPQFLAGTYKRLGELYEAKGDREKAASYYSRFIDLWNDADPELQPKVEDAKRRLASLTAAERR